MDQFLPLIIFETKKYIFQFWSESGIWVMVRFLNSNAPGLQIWLQKRQVNDPQNAKFRTLRLSNCYLRCSEVMECIKTTLLKQKKRLLPKFEVSWTKMRKNYLKKLIAERSFSNCLNEINKIIF